MQWQANYVLSITWKAKILFLWIERIKVVTSNQRFNFSLLWSIKASNSFYHKVISILKMSQCTHYNRKSLISIEFIVGQWKDYTCWTYWIKLWAILNMGKMHDELLCSFRKVEVSPRWRGNIWGLKNIQHDSISRIGNWDY